MNNVIECLVIEKSIVDKHAIGLGTKSETFTFLAVLGVHNDITIKSRE